jgi:hypothetical protein
MKSLRKIKTCQLRIYQKTANNSRSIFNVKKLLTGIKSRFFTSGAGYSETVIKLENENF